MKLERRSSFGWGATAAGSAPCRNGLVVHYDGSNQNLAGKTHTACRDYWKRTRKFHMGGRGWRDIGYSYAVCPHGIVMEGRGFGREQAAQPGGNTTWTSCTFMSGPKEKPTAEQVKAFKELRSYLRGRGLKAAIRGHRDFISTSCPGSILYGMVKDRSLEGTVSSPKPSGAKPWPGRYLRLQRPYMNGSDVKWVQDRLNAKGASPKLAEDGVYGPKSEGEVRDYQKSHNLSVDGIVGPKTWASLAK